MNKNLKIRNVPLRYRKIKLRKVQLKKLQSHESHQLDAIIKSLFKLSNSAIIFTINECFKTNYDINTKIEYLDTKFHRALFNYDEIDSDLVLLINIQKHHLEIQTLNDKKMPIRMLEYGLEIAKDSAVYKNDKWNLQMPQQAVMFVEKNKNIKDQKLSIYSANGKELLLEFNTIKLWEYTLDDLIDKKMYNVIPLLIFSYRKKFSSLLKSKRKNKEKLMKKEEENFLQTIESIKKEIEIIINRNILETDDLHEISLAMTNISEFMNKKYVHSPTLDKEVIKMTKSLYDPIVEKTAMERGKYEVAKNLLINNVDIDIISRSTNIPIEKIKEIKQELL
ncbi:hypothetical protein AN639_08275 [Candidatus Epulonipiscium fishelsonii]|nr:hypothetical protein AN639_08275 [Epulopiscium sp. SCG-B05WGA-EpuloA1]